MSATRKEREMFIAQTAKLGVRYEDAAKLLRYAATLQRLSEAQCNGDWPADNGVRPSVQCKRCEGSWDAGAIRKRDGLCVDCRTEDKARDLAKSIGLRVMVAGDPRGYVLRIMHLIPLKDLRSDYPVCVVDDCVESDRHHHSGLNLSGDRREYFAPRWSDIGVPS